MAQPGAGQRAPKWNFGRMATRASAIATVVIGACVLVATLAITVAVQTQYDRILATVIVLVCGLALGLLLVWSGATNLRQLARPSNIPPGVSQFLASDQTDVKATLDPATLSPAESIINWLGPGDLHGRGFTSGAWVVMSHETDRNPFNTIVLTSTQIVGFMLGPDDLELVEGSSARKGVTTFINEMETSSTYAKDIQFEALNKGRWGDMVTAVTRAGLEHAIQTHLNFGLPYAAIASFRVSKGLVNRGIRLTLRDGRRLKFVTTQNLKQIKSVARSLASAVTEIS